MTFFKRYKIKSLNKKLKALQQSRLSTQPSEEALIKERAIYKSLVDIYKSLRGKKKYPFADQMIRECQRAAAAIDDAEAQYLLGKDLLEEAKFREQLEKDKIFASTINEKRMAQLYEEAHAYFIAAQKLNHIQAKRLQGLAYINGWGVDPDREKGFEMIVASINQENSWDKVPQIFASLGLNKPEFFSALTKLRGKS
ncbi:hypothetical protein Lqui_2251 [Legionella quinlivanii]|uniref:Uncharacterized protein n=1 Tax=Legionella quinlivanii TaxID=45073 RepID=A0A0W0XUX3_9GAMM|nr:hypothetical protein [Legionella quinlivanii]KTD47987.1 hypothetical protein Lqui_2251 [Legionella quinlivanii]MCW8450732.1 hypothetical protein [Legionella quinlivanii]SEG20685.1 hypothetical protein SAMN02746093_02177 [Legionella quinlivanii DSM 21216]STY11099.1 Uncharacterised protein [Legionella quinlivanii]